jgi:hypothetical protein
MMTSDLFKRYVRLALAALLVAAVAVTCIEVLAFATGAPAIEGRMLSTGPLP